MWSHLFTDATHFDGAFTSKLLFIWCLELCAHIYTEHCIDGDVLQMSSTRSADQKTTLLHFLANTVEKKHPELMDFAKELRNVEPASRGTIYLFQLKF